MGALCANFLVVKYTVACTFESTKLVQEICMLRYKYWYGRTLEGILPSTYHGTVFLVAAKSKKDVRAATARGFP